jgi:hypothetical protein
MAARERHAWATLNVPSSRQLYLWSLEDVDLPRADDVPWQAMVRGRSSRRVAVMVLRDPYNWLASRILSRRVDAACPAIIERWIRCAEALKRGRSPIDDHVDHVVWVRYNYWFQDPAYRATLARRLGFEPSDIGLNTVSPEGGGSSVDGLALDGNAQAMRVLHRWEEVAPFPAYRRLFKERPELARLSEELFGLRPFA